MPSVMWGHQSGRNVPCQGCHEWKQCRKGDEPHKEWTPSLDNHYCVSWLCCVFHQSTQVVSTPAFIHTYCGLMFECSYVIERTYIFLHAIIKGVMLATDGAKTSLHLVPYCRKNRGCTCYKLHVQFSGISFRRRAAVHSSFFFSNKSKQM